MKSTCASIIEIVFGADWILTVSCVRPVSILPVSLVRPESILPISLVRPFYYYFYYSITITLNCLVLEIYQEAFRKATTDRIHNVSSQLFSHTLL